jgi:hypothetical protein
MPARIVTHSLGGTVTSVALWNVDRTINMNRRRGREVCPVVLAGGKRGMVSRARFRPADEWYCLYRHRQDDATRYATPRLRDLRDLRVGTIVPATPTETFLDDRFRTPPGSGGRIQRIVVGINPKDYAVTRGAANLEAGCRARIGALDLGGTCAAVDSVSVRRHLLNRCQVDGDTLARLVHFTDWPDTPKKYGRQDHALTVYARRPEMPAFLSLVFDAALIPKAGPGCRPHAESAR